MIRIFNLYFSARSLVLLGGEAAVICLSFLLAIVIRFGQDAVVVLRYENGFAKVFAITALALLCSHYADLFDLQKLQVRGETYFRLLVLVGTLSLLLGGATYVFPRFLVGKGVFLTGVCILPPAWISWRWAYDWLIHLPRFRERLYLLGTGERAKRLAEALRARPELGIDLVGWTGALGNGSLTREAMGSALTELTRKRGVDRVVVSLADRRGKLPVSELLELRLAGFKVEDDTALQEKIFGKIEVEELYPSWLIFSAGFRLSPASLFVRRLVSLIVALIGLVLVLPLIPLIMAAIKLTSPGPVLYRQKRVGRNGALFNCYKFRTMRPDAEADTGPTWADDADPRITTLGRWLRASRLDEIPQLWNVFRGEMAFVGPRPERPEFVEWLSREIPYYNLRHIVRPGITGWAQVNHGYGASIDESKEKLRYDLYYIKNISLPLDLMILAKTIKTILLQEGSR